MKKYTSLLFALVLLFSACSNFEEINVNPNNPVQVPAEMLLPPIIQGAVGSMTESGSRAGQYVQHLAWLGGTSESDGRYNLTGASFREEWNGPVRLLKDINQLKAVAQVNNQPEYESLAHILKVYTLLLMTDAYGDIPYDEAGMGNVAGKEFATFQSQEEVYALMLNDLETANQLLAQIPASVKINRDILYKGDLLKWRKFANSLKIKILMRQSAKKNVSSQVAEIFNNPANHPVFASVSDGATLTYNNNSDFYRWFIQNPPADGSGVNFESNERISDVMVNLLSSANDPRLTVYAAPTKNSYLGNRANPTRPLEYRGQRAGLSLLEQENFYKESGLNRDDLSVIGRQIRQENRAFLMTYSELLLLKSEAIIRNMGVQGDAAATYHAAVNASLDKWGASIAQGQKEAYWNTPGNAFNSSKGMEQIAHQLFIDSYLNGFEGWASWRRLGLPKLQTGPSVLSPIPVRYVYSDNEQNNPKLIDWVNEHMGGKMPDHNVKVWFQP